MPSLGSIRYSFLVVAISSLVSNLPPGDLPWKLEFPRLSDTSIP